MAYKIQINEWQRHVIELALQGLDDSTLPPVDDSDHWGLFGSDTPSEEFMMLLKMVTELKAEENLHPGATHGFCL